MFSVFNPSKCTHLEQWAADCAAPGEQSWTSCRSRDSNPQPWVTSGFKSNDSYVKRSSRGILLKFYRWRYQANAPLKLLSDTFTTIPIFTTLNAHCCPVVVFLKPAGGGEPGCMGPVYSFNINRKSQLRSSSGKA